MKRVNWKQWALPLAGAALLAGCAGDGEDLLGTPPSGPAAELFARYVAMGNSITAGYQSAGINDSTQLLAYPNLLAEQVGVPFGMPLLNRPGCPPPLLAPFSPARVGGPGAPACALRQTPAPALVQDLAVPGAEIASALDMTVEANALTTLILGGRTPVQAMQQARPTFVSAWYGNNDVLGAALGGLAAPPLLTSVADFTTSLDALVAGIKGSTAKDAVLIGVVDVVTVPALMPGAYFYLAASLTGGRFGGPQGPAVSPTCAPGTPGGSNFVSIQMLTDTVFQRLGTLECANDYMAPTTAQGYFPGRYVLTAAEAGVISARVAEFNALLEAAAAANGWIYFDPNPLLTSYLPDPSALRKCQALPAALMTGDPAQIGLALQSTCPSPDPSAGFGSLISYDGVHPSTRAHQLIANELIGLINAKHQLNIPSIPVS